MRVRSNSNRVLGAALPVLLFSASAHAAMISWSNVQNITGPGTTTVSTTKQGGPGANLTITNGTNDVNTQGTQVFGINYSGVPGSTFPYTTTIDGQNFDSYRDTSAFAVTYGVSQLEQAYVGFGPPGTAGQAYGSSDSGGVGPNPDYTLANAGFGNEATALITLGNLIQGDDYLLQFWVSDPRNSETAARIETLNSSTGGDTNVPTLQYEAPGSTDGQWVIGTFVADSSLSETLDLAAGSSAGLSSSTQVNLLQLRDVTPTSVPEPASLALIGVGALALRRRRCA